MTTVEVARDGVALLYCAIILLVLSWIVFSIRVGVRMWRKAWGMDDYFMLVGTILFSVTAALCIVCCHYGSGQFARELPTVTISKGTKLFYIAEYFYAVSAMFVKISVAVALLRIAVGRRFFTWALWALIGATMVAALVFCIGIANICDLFYSAIEITADFSLSIMPAILLWNVQMKGAVKASVAVMLALASFASCATIVRLKYLTLYSDPGEFMYSTGKIGFWSLTEVGIGLIAGSLPPLRPLLSLRIRVSAGSNTPAASGGQAYQSGINNRQPTSRSRVIAMDTFQTLGDNDEADNSDGDSQKNIIKETKFTVTSVIAGGPRDPGPMAWDRKEGSNV
ncbi:hypothetical protein J4E93_006571 [Alternaria ventricosa]|uniref:uncharacterized protein n=1 Tax=Alternaria ventricosa TaxID=1187951 RepID=UPI0020C1D4BB|nr:uncharacterized protein J4E93_006571 [Alternaria ventricosa]KAI4643561.1 hypothetical protein J4E93_006571 [Alternaria ventricosa]